MTDKITKEEIITLASRYVPVDKTDFPLDGELFFFLTRKLKENKVLKENEGWMFSGYGQCTGYSMDEETKPRGKWIFMCYLDLARFPLVEQVLKLQPPHIACGQFFSPDRTAEFRIVKCGAQNLGETEIRQRSSQSPDNIIEFPSISTGES